MSDPRHDRLPPDTTGGDWRRWQMAELPPRQDARTAAPGRVVKSTASAGADNMAQMQSQARETAHREGYQAGFAEGRELGQEQGFAQGREEGQARGLEEGRHQAAAELEQRLRERVDPLLPLARQFSEAIAELDDDIANSLVELAFEVGRQLARDALKARPKAILDLVRELLHSEPALLGKPRLWLHPADFALVHDALGDEFAAANWVLQPDDQITRGGCKVTSAGGELDASWETRCEAIRSQLRKRRSTTATPPVGAQSLRESTGPDRAGDCAPTGGGSREKSGRSKS